MNRALKAGICVVVCLIGICCVGVVLLLMEMIVEDHKAQLRDNEVLTQHLGDVQSFELDWGELEFSKAEHMVFNVAGTKGSGVVTVKSMTVLDAEQEEIRWARLTLPPGETHDLLLDRPAPPPPGLATQTLPF